MASNPVPPEPTGAYTPDPDILQSASGPAGAERPGTVIGPYRLLEVLGEGGMGTVYVAEQEQPVKRRVALKVIKPGMDSAQVIARFEAERQALALMDHPNIARVLDAGTTGAGLRLTSRPTRCWHSARTVSGWPPARGYDQGGQGNRGHDQGSAACLQKQGSSRPVRPT
jgi:hypothetical protein